jgi:hypothetical protein
VSDRIGEAWRRVRGVFEQPAPEAEASPFTIL